MRGKWILLVVLIAAVLVVDQVTKHRVLDSLLLGQSVRPVPALYPYFQLTYSQNTGSAFGFLPQAGDVFLVIAIVVVLAMFFFYPRVPVNARATQVGIALICGGALGNAADRIQHGFVVDFIHYQIPGLISNVSNLADHAIVLGVVLVIVDGWRSDREARQSDSRTDVQIENEEDTPHA